MTNWLDEREMAAWLRLASLLELGPGVLETQLKRDSKLSHFEYWVLAMLSEAPEQTLSMSALAGRTRGTLPRLSHVVSRLEGRGLVERRHAPDDARVSIATLTTAGLAEVQEAAPGHVETVRSAFIDALTPEQLEQLTAIGDAILARFAPEALRAIQTQTSGQAPDPRACRGQLLSDSPR